MKKILYISVFLTYFLLGNKFDSYAKEFETEMDNAPQSKTDRYIRNVYDKIKFNKVTKISFTAFKYGMIGYLNMVEAGKINEGSLLTICDFTLSSNLKRMWVFDLRTYKVLFNTLVAHGMGTGEEFATVFSNTEDSHQSSLGFYVTGETYDGNNGYSLKLHGVDGVFNSNAFDRAIVIHGADYVSEQFARDNKRIGRSHGCPALPVEVASKVIDKVKNGSCLFIYHSSKNYLSSSYWLKNKIKQLPDDAERLDLMAGNFNNPRYIEQKNDAETNSESNCNSSCEEVPKSKVNEATSKTVTTEKAANKPHIISSVEMVEQSKSGEVTNKTIIK